MRLKQSMQSLLRTAVWLSALSMGAPLLTACDAEPEKPKVVQAKEIILNVRTLDKSSKPVEMVRFYINSKKFGITDQDGNFKGRYAAKDGDLLTFNVEAPTGYSVPADVDQSQWKYEVRYPPDGRSLQVDFTATLQRPERQYLFMVRAKAPATPVQVNGKTAGKTGASGEALLFVKGVPGTNFAARAGSVVFNGKFAEDEAVYLMAPERQAQIGGTQDDEPVAAAPATVAPPSAAPESIAAAATEPAQPVTAAPVAVVTDAPIAVVTDAPAAAPITVAAVAKTPKSDNFLEGFGDSTPKQVEKRDPPPRTRRDPPPRPRRDPPPVVVVAEPEPQPEPQPVPQPAPQPVPEPTAVVANPEPKGGGDDLAGLLGPDVAVQVAPAEPEAPPIAAAETKPARPGTRRDRDRKEDSLGGGLIDDDGGEVDRKAIEKKATLTASNAGSPSAMSRQEVDAELSRIKRSLSGSKVLARGDVDFLGQVDRSQPSYYEANRLLADYYYRINDSKRQAASLEIATSRGRYKHDPSILLSLAKAYGKRKNYGKALRAMGRVERKMRRLPAGKKADAYRFYAELLEFEFLRQFGKDQKAANTLLVDKAIGKWERYQTFNRGADAGGVAKAKRKIKELKELKKRVEL